MKLAVDLRFAIYLAVALTFCGCETGTRIVPVAGQVLIDGEPVTRGFVRFVPNGERPAYGELDKQGRFRLTTTERDHDGCVIGEHQVEIIAKEFPDETTTKWLIPKKYADLTTSGLKVSIIGPEENLKLELKWNGEEPEIERSVATGDVAPSKSAD